MIVLAIMGLFMAFGAQKLRNDGSKMKSAVRKLSVLTKKIRNHARIDNITYRLVIDMPEKGKKKAQAFWVESTNKTVVLGKKYEEEVDKKTGKKIDPLGFAVSNKIFKKNPQYLPDRLFFDRIESDAGKTETKSGRVYVHFFPEGRVEEVAIHLTNKDSLNWTVLIHPVTGRATMLNGDKPMAELIKR